MTTPASATVSRTLSIVILARKNTSYAFGQMLDDLHRQTVEPAEILVTDCNTPGDPYSLSLQEDISHRENLRLLPVHRRDTLADICNAALEECSGSYVCFIDSSDNWQPVKAERQIAMLESMPAAPACCCNGFSKMSESGSVDSSLIFKQASADTARWLTTEQFALSSQVMYRTELLRQIGGFDNALNAHLDQDALIRLSEHGTVCFLTDPLFENTAAETGCTPEQEYRALKHLMYKHYDMLLRDRKEYYHYSMKLAKSAAACTLWLNMCAHSAAGMIKAPAYTIRMFTASAARSVVTTLRQSWRGLKLWRQTNAFLRSMKSLRKTEAPALIPATIHQTDGVEEFILDPTQHNRPLQFAGNKKLVHVVIPDHMTVIHYGMFAGCRNLERIVIPATVTRIEDHAFQGCGKLRYVDVQPGSRLTHVGAYAFAGCSSLTELTLSGNVAHMGAYAFAGCTNLSALRFAYTEDDQHIVKPIYPSVMDCIPQGLFAGCRALNEVMFPEGSLLSGVGKEAFMSCVNLQRVYLNGHIDSIGEYAFAQCHALDGFVMPQIDAVSSIGRGAFRNCRSLSYFRLPYALTNISGGCFAGCSSLKYIKVPRNVVYIEPRAFANCRDLESVILLSVNTKFATNAFDSSARIDRGQTSAVS